MHFHVSRIFATLAGPEHYKITHRPMLGSLQESESRTHVPTAKEAATAPEYMHCLVVSFLPAPRSLAAPHIAAACAATGGDYPRRSQTIGGGIHNDSTFPLFGLAPFLAVLCCAGAAGSCRSVSLSAGSRDRRARRPPFRISSLAVLARSCDTARPSGVEAATLSCAA